MDVLELPVLKAIFLSYPFFKRTFIRKNVRTAANSVKDLRVINVVCALMSKQSS